MTSLNKFDDFKERTQDVLQICNCSILQIFSIHYFFAEGEKVKGMVRNDVFGDGVGRSMDFLSVCASPKRCALPITRDLGNVAQLSNAKK